MHKTGKIMLAAGVVLLVAIAVVLFASKQAATPTNPNTTPNSQGQSGSQAATDVVITYDGSSFTLSATTLKSGGTVKVVNDSTKDLDFDSDPHPTHTANSQLNAGEIPAGQSVMFTLTTKGKWGFHNHLNASQKGELTVE